MQDYTTGRAARAIGVSQSILRALCQAGLVAARSSPGGHWRIAKTEVLRLRRDGVPDLPTSSLEEPEAAPSALAAPSTPAPAPRHPGLLADPSPETVAAADEVVRLENEVKSITLKRARTEGLDWFRARRTQLASQVAAQQKLRLHAQADRLRERWEAAWMEYAFVECVPKDCPRGIDGDVFRAVQESLGELDARDPRRVVERLVRGSVEKALSSWRRRQQIEKVIREEVKDGIPIRAQGFASSPSDWEIRAARNATVAISQLSGDADILEIRQAARHAIGEIRSEYDAHVAADSHRRACDEIIQWVFDGDEARAAVRAALEELPVGSEYSEMRKVRDAALEPFRAKERANREAESHLHYVREYVDEIGNESDGEWDLGNFADRYKLAEQLKPRVRAKLATKFLRDEFDRDEEIDIQVREFIEECVDRELGL